jgi:hypothetical protein
MAHVISFRTSRFDPTKERPNPINPIAGESVLIWLRENVFREPYSSTEPDAEDWGWYIDVQIDGESYLVGSCAQIDEEPEIGEEIEWPLQIHKNRTFIEKLLGRNKMAVDDSLVSKVLDTFKNDAAFHHVTVERDA